MFFQISHQGSCVSHGADSIHSSGTAHNCLDPTVFVKNARVSSNERLFQLICDLDSIHWDMIVFSETRTPSNDFQIEGNHRLMLNFGHQGCSGTAILVHQRHADNVKAIHRIHDRLLALDFQIRGCVLRIAGIYKLHAGYNADELHSIYDKLHALFDYGMHKRFDFIIGGDFNTIINPSLVILNSLAE